MARSCAATRSIATSALDTILLICSQTRLRVISKHNGDRRYFWDSGADAIRRSSARRPGPSRLPGVGWHVQPWSAHRTGAAHAAAPLLKPQFWISAAQQPVPSRLPGRGWHLQQWLAHRTRAAHASAPLWKMQFWISASQWPAPIQMPVVGWATRVSSSH